VRRLKQVRELVRRVEPLLPVPMFGDQAIFDPPDVDAEPAAVARKSDDHAMGPRPGSEGDGATQDKATFDCDLPLGRVMHRVTAPGPCGGKAARAA
jgi:hypothetical protein